MRFGWVGFLGFCTSKKNIWKRFFGGFMDLTRNLYLVEDDSFFMVDIWTLVEDIGFRFCGGSHFG